MQAGSTNSCIRSQLAKGFTGTRQEKNLRTDDSRTNRVCEVQQRLAHGDRTLMCPMRVNENDDASPFETRARVVYYIHREHSGHVIIEQQAKHLRRGGIGIQFCDGKWTSKKRKAAARNPIGGDRISFRNYRTFHDLRSRVCQPGIRDSTVLLVRHWVAMRKSNLAMAMFWSNTESADLRPFVQYYIAKHQAGLKELEE